MLSDTTKTTINIAVPATVAGIVVFLLWKKGWKVAVPLAIVAAAISWAITAAITKNLNTPPPPAQVDTNVQGGAGGQSACDAYDPTPLGDAIYNDLTCTWCFRNNDIYDRFLALPSCQFRKVYNYFNSTYYTKTGATIAVMLGNLSTFTSFNGTFTNVQVPQLLTKFNDEGLQ